MRIRLSIQLDVRRGHDADESRESSVDALVERAEPQRLGFTIPTTQDEDEALAIRGLIL